MSDFNLNENADEVNELQPDTNAAWDAAEVNRNQEAAKTQGGFGKYFIVYISEFLNIYYT